MKKLTFLMMAIVALFIFACGGANNDMEKMKNNVRDYYYRLDNMDAGKIIASNAKDIDKAQLEIDTLQKQIDAATDQQVIDSLQKELDFNKEKKEKTLKALKENLEKLGIDDFIASLKEMEEADMDNLDSKYLSTEKNKEADRDLSKLNDRLKQYNDVLKQIKDALYKDQVDTTYERKMEKGVETIDTIINTIRVPKYEGIEFDYQDLTIGVLPNEPTPRSQAK